MSEENVVPFHSRPEPMVWSDGRVQTECDERAHLFARVPGPCACGEKHWVMNTDELIEEPRPVTP